MCFTVMGRVQTRLYSLVWPLALTIVFGIVSQSGDYWTMFALMALTGFALDAFIYPRFIGYQGRWLTVALGVVEYMVIRLAAAIVPLITVTLRRALRGDFIRHRRIARWTYPLWVYVSVTGVIVYLMLYRLYPAR